MGNGLYAHSNTRSRATLAHALTSIHRCLTNWGSPTPIIDLLPPLHCTIIKRCITVLKLKVVPIFRGVWRMEPQKMYRLLSKKEGIFKNRIAGGERKCVVSHSQQIWRDSCSPAKCVRSAWQSVTFNLSRLEKSGNWSPNRLKVCDAIIPFGHRLRTTKPN